MFPKRSLAILFSILIIATIVGLTFRFVFAQIGWYEPTNTPPEDNEIPLWIKNGINLYHTTGGWAGFLTNDPKGTIHLSGGQSWGTDLNLDSTGLSGGRRWLLISTGGNASEGQGKFLIKDNNANAVRLTIDTSGNVTIPGVLTVGSCSGCVSSITWASVTNKPAGFDDNTDNVGITSESDPTVYQFAKVVLPTCSAAQKLTGNGTSLSCAADTDTNTTYSAGTNLSLSGTTFNVVNSPSFSGNVGIGATTIDAKLEVLRTTGGTVSSSENPALDSVSTWTSGRNYGIRAEATGSGATVNTGGAFNAAGASINRGIYISGPSAGASNYAIYSGSSARSYFAGDLTVNGNTTLGNASADTTTVNGSFQMANATTVSSSEITSAKPDNYLKIRVNGTDYAIPLYIFGWLVNSKHTVGDCINNGGTVVISGADKFCQFTNNTFPGFGGGTSSSVSCPSGWSRYDNWTKTAGSTCTGQSFAGCTGRSSCSTASHSWQNKAQETCTYESEGWKLSQGCFTGTKTCYAWVLQIGCY